MKEEALQANMESTDLNDYFLQKRFEVMIDTHNKRVVNEISNIHSMISKLNNEIDEIKKHLADKPKAEIPKICEEENKPSLKGKSEPISRPRYGDYKPEDVAVDKFFYFGGKG